MRGFTRALKTAEHDDCRGLGSNFKLAGVTAHQSGKLFVYDLNDLICRCQGFHNLNADRTFRNGFDEFFDDLEIDIRFEQGELDLTHSCLDIRFGQFTLVAEALECIA